MHRNRNKGAKLIITYLNDRKEAEKTADECMQRSARDIIVCRLDVRNKNYIRKCIDLILEKFSKISILINNADVIS